MNGWSPQERRDLAGAILMLLGRLRLPGFPQTEEAILAVSRARREEARALRDRLEKILPSEPGEGEEADPR